jgi:predicted HicB family RNase H-like nuclease
MMKTQVSKESATTWKHIGLRVPAELRRAARMICAQRDESLAVFITEAMTDRIAKFTPSTAGRLKD